MTLALPRAELTEVSLTMPPDASYEEWEEQGHRLFTMERSVMWWIGDWWRFGEHRYGERAAQALDSRYSFGTLRNAGYVAGAIEAARRRDALDFGHHQNVAALPAEEQDYWLDEAEQGEWSVHELRARIKRGLTTDGPIPYTTPRELDQQAKAQELVAHVEALDALRDALGADAARAHLHVRSRAAFARRLRQVGTYLGHVALELEQEETNGTRSAAA